MLGLGFLALGVLLLQQTAISSAKTCTLSASTASQLNLDASNVQDLLVMMGYAHYSCSSQGTPIYNGTVSDVFDVTCSADDIVSDLSKAREAGLAPPAAEVLVRGTIGNVAPDGTQFSIDGGAGQMDVVQLTNPSRNLTTLNPNFSNGQSSKDLTDYVADASSNPGGVHSVNRIDSFGGGPPSGTCSPNTIAKSRVVSLLALVQTNADGTSSGLSSSSSDSSTLKQLLNFSHIITGIVAIAAILGLLGLALGVYSCTRAAGVSRFVPTAYQPVQLAAPSKPYNTPYDAYRDEPMRYDS